MTSGPIGLDLAEVSKANAPQVTDVPAAPGPINQKNEKLLTIGDDSSQSPSNRKGSLTDADGKEYPTAEEVHTLRRVCGSVPWAAYTIAFIELCERFSYYGTTQVCMWISVHRNGLRQIFDANHEYQSSISSRIHCRMDQGLGPPPQGKLVPWDWASEPRLD